MSILARCLPHKDSTKRSKQSKDLAWDHLQVSVLARGVFKKSQLNGIKRGRDPL